MSTYKKTLDCKGAYCIMLNAIGEDGDPEDYERVIAFEEEGVVDPDWLSRFEHTVWRLEEVPLDKVWIDKKYVIDDDKVDAYAKMEDIYGEEIEEFPPILLHPDGHPLDGQHRVLAAQKRGDRSILAYVPTKGRRTR